MAEALRQTIAATSPAAASTVALTPTASGLERCHSVTINALVRGATGGTLDVYVQTSHDDGATWIDLLHLPQLAAGAAVVRYVTHVARAASTSATVVVGSGTSPALALNTLAGGSWGDSMRVLLVAGVSTSAGAAQSIEIVGHR
jgi:hypothetical protein